MHKGNRFEYLLPYVNSNFILIFSHFIMLIFLCFIFFINATIPNEYKDLAEKAIANSKTKVQHDKRVNTAFPGDYSFPNVEFKLKKNN